MVGNRSQNNRFLYQLIFFIGLLFYPYFYEDIFRLSFYYIGVAILFPYTMLINLTDFWNYKLRNVSSEWNVTDTHLNHIQESHIIFMSCLYQRCVITSAFWPR